MVKCNQCGTENDDKADFCQECGEKIIPKKPKTRKNKLVYIGLGILGIIVLVVAVLMLTSTPGVTDFDRALIKGVNNGESAEISIPYIKQNSQIQRDAAKTNYDSRVSALQATNSTSLIDEAKADYEKELSCIQKDEDAQMSFVKGEINEETFKKKLMDNYKEYQS